MKRWKGWVAVGMLASAMSLVSLPAASEGFADLYLGAAFSQDAPVRVRPGGIFGLSSGTQSLSGTVSAGVRIGYWLEGLPWLGIAGDLSYYNANFSLFFDPEIDVVPVSALVMLRASLAQSDAFPNGRVQPYAGIGPGLFISDYYQDVLSGGRFEATSVDAGLDVRAGLKLLPLDWLAVLVEYRFTHVSPTWSDFVQTSRQSVQLDLDTHHVYVGLGFPF